MTFASSVPGASQENKADHEATVASPCIGVCRLNAATGLCEGCLRTMDEIACWGSAAEADKRRIWELIYQRQQ